jgi:hypothetical protein
VKQIKVLLGPLLPALWLLASGLCCFDLPLDDFQDDCLTPLPAARQHGRLAFRRHSGSFQLPGSLVAGHFWTGGGGDDPPSLDSVLPPMLPDAGKPAAGAASAGSPAARELANSWQFLCRAARAPRAPSLVW